MSTGFRSSTPKRPFAILAALQTLADEARVSADPSASRYEAILPPKQTPLLFPRFWKRHYQIRLLGSKEESEVANSIAKITRQRGPSSFHPYARWNSPQRSAVPIRDVPPRGARRGLIVASAGTSKNIVRHFDYEMMSCCNKRTCMYFFFVLFFFSKLITPSCVPVLSCLECRCLMPFMPLWGCLKGQSRGDFPIFFVTSLLKLYQSTLLIHESFLDHKGTILNEFSKEKTSQN